MTDAFNDLTEKYDCLYSRKKKSVCRYREKFPNPLDHLTL